MARFCLIVAVILCARGATAVDVVVDYSFNTSSFFSPATADGQAARDTIEFAARYYSELLTDTLSPIETPADFESGPFNGVLSWQWQQTFSNPSTGQTTTLTNPTIAQDEYRLYVGAQALGGSTLGVGGPGGFGWSTSSSGNGFTSGEIAQINQITADFSDAVERRGENSGFARWGGSVTFDSQATWNLGLEAPTSSNQNDLLSVALHEIGHALGFGLVNEFLSQRSGSSFTGPTSVAANGQPPQLTPDGGHWVNGTQSNVLGTNQQQETAFDPSITTGTRKLLTELDVASLVDIGWEIPLLPGDYNGDGLVDAGDYTLWRDSLGSTDVIGDYDVWSASVGTSTAGTFLASTSNAAAVPEPTSALLALAACLTAGRRR